MQHSTRLAKTFSILTASLLLSLGAFNLSGIANSNIVNPRQSLPGRRISGGVRDSRVVSCFADFDQSLVSVIPYSNLGTTAEAHPTFWFSVPETTADKSVEFKLVDEDEEIVYETQIEMGQEYGLSEFQLPETARELSVNENYKWTLALSCSRDASSPVLGLEGWVSRVDLSPELAAQIEMATAEERVDLYRAAGLWHEQVTEVLNLRRRDATNINYQLEWATLAQTTELAPHLANNIVESMTAIETTVQAD